MAAVTIPAGSNIPAEFNVIIEIPANGGDIKYEVDKDSGLLMVDRFMTVAMHYPCNYGYVPSTLAEDGDPMDVLVYTPYPIQPGAMLKARPIAMLEMTDEAGRDSKILAVPTAKACAEFAHMQSIKDVPKVLLDKINHFFEQYKALEPNKWVKVDGWKDVDVAAAALEESVKAYKG